MIMLTTAIPTTGLYLYHTSYAMQSAVTATAEFLVIAIIYCAINQFWLFWQTNIL